MTVFGSALIGFLLAVAILVTVHELGHYLAARWCGVRVERFSIGFGPVLLRWRGRRSIFAGTEFAISAIPLGGYVRMLDTRDPERSRSANVDEAFDKQPLWKRSLIVAAGPLANFLLAAVLYMGALAVPDQHLATYVERPAPDTPAAIAGVRGGDRLVEVDGHPVAHWGDVRWRLLLNLFADEMTVVLDRQGERKSLRLTRQLDTAIDEQTGVGARLSGWGLAFDQPAVIGRVLEAGAAAEAGMQVGDEVVAVDGKTIRQWSEFTQVVQRSPERPLRLEVLRRGGERVSLTLTPAALEADGNRIGRAGVAAAPATELHPEWLVERRRTPLEAVAAGVTRTWEGTYLTVRVMWGMLTGDVSLRQVSGPLTMAEGAGATLTQGGTAFVLFLAIISISIGVLNLLPVPMLDGGQLLYHLAEAIKGAPLSERAELMGQRIGLLFIAALTCLAFYNDFLRIFS